MSWIDLLALAVLAYNVLRGFSTGLVRSAVSLFALVLATAAVYHLPPWAASWADSIPVAGALGELVRPAAVWVLVFTAVSAVGSALRALLQRTPLRAVDHLGGAALGLGTGALVLAVPLVVLGSMPLLQQLPLIQSLLQGSLVASTLSPLVARLLAP